MRCRSRTSNRSQTGRRALIAAVFTTGSLLFGYAWAERFHREFLPSELIDSAAVEPQTQEKDYSRFTHTNPYHSRMPCLLCHRRDNNSARIGFPGKAGHLPCAGCHALQFSDSSSPICTICHTNVQTGVMKRFPGLQTFGRKFDHAKHSRVNCSICHKPAQRGIAFSIPSGSTAHSTCFQCHSSSAAFSMSSCSVCHQLGRLVRTSAVAKAFRVNFSHARHISKGMNCAACHTVRARASTGRQVSAPLASMHFAPAGASCAACHNGTRAFGPNDFANCRRCHVDNTFRF